MLRSLLLVGCLSGWLFADEPEFASHPPTRPLPTPSDRPLGDGPQFFVDAEQGADNNAGSETAPWRTLAHAVTRLRPGFTLVLRGGVYFERVTLAQSGTDAEPITLRAYPGELVVLDGGIPIFQTDPQTAWEPVPGGATHEFRSTAAYPSLGGREGETNLLGNFADSLVPLHGYRHARDFRSDNPYWSLRDKASSEQHVYCGPGLWFDTTTGRVHVRLAHTNMPWIGDGNYRGATDPRTAPLVVAGYAGGPVLKLDRVRNVILQDLVLRGAREATLDIRECQRITLDGLTVYGGSKPIDALDVRGLRVLHTACRGLAAPWTFRASLKYRAIESRLFSANSWQPTGGDGRDFEIAYSEFTDSVDGVFIGNVRGVRFHHNVVDNVSDDGLFLTANTGYDGITPGGDVDITQNHFARCLTTFAFGVGKGRQKSLGEQAKQLGGGVHITRNVFDLRGPVMYYWPSGPDSEQELVSRGRIASDHGSPAWESMRLTHNTILAGGPPRGGYGTDGLGNATGKGTTRRVLNNIVCLKRGRPGDALPPVTHDFRADGNLFWSMTDGESVKPSLFARFRNSEAFAQSATDNAPAWTTHDRVADPQFVSLSADWRTAPDLRLSASSPAIDSGVRLPQAWPDPLRSADDDAPDIGALPRGLPPWPVGVRGRLDVCGAPRTPGVTFTPAPWEAVVAPSRREFSALVIEGYPAFDAPLVAYGMRKRGATVDTVRRTWIEPRTFGTYDLVVIDGSFSRANIEPSRFREQDLPHLRTFLEEGGTLLLMRDQRDLFNTPHGKAFLTEIVGAGVRETAPEFRILAQNHPWVRHLSSDASLSRFVAKSALPTGKGEVILGSEQGAAILYQARVGQGRFVYVGWMPSRVLPEGRKPSTPAMEREYETQAQILWNLLGDVVGSGEQTPR